MEINSVSRLQQLSELQGLSSIYSPNTSNSTPSSAFSDMLSEILKNSTDKSLTSTSNDNAAANNNEKVTNNNINSIDGLTIQPQKLALMMQMMSLQSMTSNAASIGSIDSSTDSDTSISNISGGSDDMSQMLNYMMESMLGNDDSGEANSQALGSTEGFDGLGSV